MQIEKLLKTHGKLPLEKRVLINLMLASSGTTAQISEALKAFGVSLQQFNVLRILRGQEGEALNLHEIQSRMVHKMSNTTRLVDKLINKDLVERKECPKNRRKVDINITEAGESLLDKIDPVMQNTEQDLVKGFSVEELKTLDKLLDKLRA